MPDSPAAPVTGAFDGLPPSAELRHDATSRKRFLRMVGAGGGTAFSLLLSACGSDDGSGSSAPAAPGPARPAPVAASPGQAGDLRIVNYALTLEHIEAGFYQQVIDSGAIKDRRTLELIKRIGENETEHVQALTSTVKELGGTPAGAPKTRFQDVLAGGSAVILKTAAMIENLGASAYLGQAPAIRSKDVLAAALSIHTVEARHAAALNKLATNRFKTADALVGSIPDGAFARPMNMSQVLGHVKPFLA